MIASRLSVALVLGCALAVAACGGEGLILPPDGAPANIEVMSGSGQSGRVGSALPNPVVVRVTDTQGRPVADATVNFSFTDAGSSATPATATTNSDGLASSILTLGTREGELTGRAEVPVDAGVTPVEVTFTAIARSDDANGIALVSGNDQSAPVNTGLPDPLVVQVSDAFGNPIAGVTVTGASRAAAASARRLPRPGSTVKHRSPGSSARLPVSRRRWPPRRDWPVPRSHSCTRRPLVPRRE